MEKIPQTYTDKEKKFLISKVVQVSLEECFENYIYQSYNILFRQLVGGGIGARVTGVVVFVLMDVWADLMAENLQDNGFILYLLTKYVDDINLASSIIKKGYSWVKETTSGSWRLRWSREREEIDDQGGESDEMRTMELIRELADKLIPG